jgi:hypothetical protein
VSTTSHSQVVKIHDSSGHTPGILFNGMSITLPGGSNCMYGTTSQTFIITGIHYDYVDVVRNVDGPASASVDDYCGGTTIQQAPFSFTNLN